MISEKASKNSNTTRRIYSKDSESDSRRLLHYQQFVFYYYNYAL